MGVPSLAAAVASTRPAYFSCWIFAEPDFAIRQQLRERAARLFGARAFRDAFTVLFRRVDAV